MSGFAIANLKVGTIATGSCLEPQGSPQRQLLLSPDGRATHPPGYLNKVICGSSGMIFLRLSLPSVLQSLCEAVAAIATLCKDLGSQTYM